MCVLSFKKSRNVCNSIFMNVTKNNKTCCQKNVLVFSKMPRIAPLNTLKPRKGTPKFLRSFIPTGLGAGAGAGAETGAGAGRGKISRWFF